MNNFFWFVFFRKTFFFDNCFLRISFGKIVEVENMRKSFGELKEEEKGKNFDKNVNSFTKYKIGSTTGPEGGPRTRTASTRIRTAAPFFVNRKFKSHPRGSASAVPLCSTGQSAYLLFLFTFFFLPTQFRAPLELSKKLWRS